MTGRMAALLGMAGAVIAAPAHAGPWTREEGETFVSAKAGYFVADDGITRFRRADGDVYAEYGLLDGLTVGGQAIVGHVRADTIGLEPAADFGFSLVEAFVQTRLYQGDRQVVSVRTIASPATAVDDEARLAAADGGFDLESRVLYGLGGETPLGQGFIGLEAGYRARFGPAADQARIDVTAGLEPHKRVLLLMQGFSIVSIRNEAPGGTDFDVYRLQPSAVWRANARLGLQAGAIVEVAGRNLEPGVGGFAGIWLTF